MYYNIEALKDALKTFKGNNPFDHCIIDGFLKENIAQAVED